MVFKKGHKFCGNVETLFKKGHISWSKKNKGKYHLWKDKDNPMKGKIPHNKGKTNIELYGKEKAKKLQENNKQKHLGKTHILSDIKKDELRKLRLNQWRDKSSNYHSIQRSEKIKNQRRKQILPLKDTTIEVKIQNFLKQLNIEYFTHQYLGIKHDYQTDIFIPSMNLVIECFGDYWHKIPYGNKIDSIRCQELRRKGFRVLVFWEREIRAMELNDFKRILN